MVVVFDKIWLAQMTNNKHPSRSDQEAVALNHATAGYTVHIGTEISQ